MAGAALLKLQRVLCRINFRHDFTESQCRKVRTTMLLAGIPESRNFQCSGAGKKIIAQHDNGYIDKNY